ncbi:MAG: hypothetical protein J5895_00080 [Alphaproteobacteria bacterium]|nr:hypothetical protein [Alphaproteobacteria bacterium]
MIENILYTLSESSLIASVIGVLMSALFSQEGKKTCFKIAEAGILVSAFFALLFYNKTFLEGFFTASWQTTLTYCLCALFAVCWLWLSSKWFVKQDASSTRFCVLALLLMFLLSLIIKTTNVLVLFCCLALSGLTQYALLKTSTSSEGLYHYAVKYLFSALVCLVFWGCAFYFLGAGSYDYNTLAAFVQTQSSFKAAWIVLSLFCCMLFFIGAAPFHFWYADAVSASDLPVGSYFALVPNIAFWSVFLSLYDKVFMPFAQNLKPIFVVFGCLSIVLGAIGANATRFIRKIFSFVYLYQLGVALLVLSTFRAQSAFATYIYMEVYLFLMIGVYVCLFGMRLNGEHINNLSFLKGYAFMRPYVSATLVFYILSLTGLPPFIGFISQFFMLFNVYQSLWLLYLILAGFLMLLPAYFRIIQTIYFFKKGYHFDRVEFGLYIALIVHIVFVSVLAVKPNFFMIQASLF